MRPERRRAGVGGALLARLAASPCGEAAGGSSGRYSTGTSRRRVLRVARSRAHARVGHAPARRRGARERRGMAPRGVGDRREACRCGRSPGNGRGSGSPASADRPRISRCCAARRRAQRLDRPARVRGRNAACSLLPGPASTQLAIFCASRVGGPAGAIVGGLGFIVPAVVLILALSRAVPRRTRRRCGCGAPAPAPAPRSRRSPSRPRGLVGPSFERAPRGGCAGSPTVPASRSAALIGRYLVLVLLGCGRLELVSALRRRSARPSGWWPAIASRWRRSHVGGLGALAGWRSRSARSPSAAAS